MKKLSLIVLLTISVFQVNLHAKEGMWIPLLVEELNYDDLKASGFKLTAEDIYSINKACLKDAIVMFNGGCTAELISKDGLILTNHHCGYGQIQKHSTLENNYLKNGFWSKSRDEELPNPDLSVLFLTEIQEITSKVINGLPKGLNNEERQEALAYRIDSLEAVIYDSLQQDASIEKFFEGNQYFLFLYKEYTDVRLVGAPPASIGNFGGDTDNWVWPRHTGDFSIFRIYANAQNEPAQFASNNVPYQPKKHLTISAQGVSKNDFTMVLGYPARTKEYLYSAELELIEQTIYPNNISLRQKRLDIIDRERLIDERVYIQYASKQQRISNAWKKWKGVLYGFNRFQVIQKRKDYESWLLDNAGENKAQLQELYEMFEDTYIGYAPYSEAMSFYRESIFSLEPMYFFNRKFADPYYKYINTTDKKAALDEMELLANEYFKNYNSAIDRELTEVLLSEFISGISGDFLPEIIDNHHTAGSLDKYINTLYSKSIFTDSTRFYSALKKLRAGKNYAIEEDPFLVLYNSVLDKYDSEIRSNSNYYTSQLAQLYNEYLPLIINIDTHRAIYPDANFTMRLTYGKVEGYSPRDALEYHYQTYLDGVIEKSHMGYHDYVLPEKLMDLYASKDYGRYADETGRVPVCFIASNHTSGGNSGSPVLDAEGRLIGINFDRTWEGTMSDFNFDEEICRNISVDIRYVLFIIDKFAGSSHLIEEMDIEW